MISWHETTVLQHNTTNFLLQQMAVEECLDASEEVTACVAAADAVIAVYIELRLKLNAALLTSSLFCAIM